MLTQSLDKDLDGISFYHEDLVFYLIIQVYYWIEYIEITLVYKTVKEGKNANACWSLIYNDTGVRSALIVCILL